MISTAYGAHHTNLTRPQYKRQTHHTPCYSTSTQVRNTF
jgi:hypothetical protein